MASAAGDDWAKVVAGGNGEVVGELYEECIGAKKHLVAGVSARHRCTPIKLICYWIVGAMVETIIG